MKTLVKSIHLDKHCNKLWNSLFDNEKKCINDLQTWWEKLAQPIEVISVDVFIDKFKKNSIL